MVEYILRTSCSAPPTLVVPLNGTGWLMPYHCLSHDCSGLGEAVCGVVWVHALRGARQTIRAAEGNQKRRWGVNVDLLMHFDVLGLVICRLYPTYILTCAIRLKSSEDSRCMLAHRLRTNHVYAKSRNARPPSLIEEPQSLVSFSDLMISEGSTHICSVPLREYQDDIPIPLRAGHPSGNHGPDSHSRRVDGTTPPGRDAFSGRDSPGKDPISSLSEFAESSFNPTGRLPTPKGSPKRTQSDTREGLSSLPSTLDQSSAMQDTSQKENRSWFDIPGFVRDNKRIKELEKELEQAKRERYEIFRMIDDEADRSYSTSVRDLRLYDLTKGLRDNEPKRWVAALIEARKQTLNELRKKDRDLSRKQSDLYELQDTSKGKEEDMKERHTRQIQSLEEDNKRYRDKNWSLHEDKREMQEKIDGLERLKRSLEDKIRIDEVEWQKANTNQQVEKQEWYQMGVRETQKGLQDEHKATLERIKSRVKERESKLQDARQSDAEDFKNQIEDLRDQIEELRGKLLKRDRYPQMSDKQLQQSVEDLVDQVKSVARSEWANPSTWSKNLLKVCYSSESQTALQRQIMGDTIWVVLQQYIFESPFVLFGDERNRMEENWAESFGEGS